MSSCSPDWDPTADPSGWAGGSSVKSMYSPLLILQWPALKLVLSRVSTSARSTDKLYQNSVLTQYSTQVLSNCTSTVLSDLQKLEVKLRERLAWSDVELLRSILAFLDTRSWVAPLKPTVAVEADSSDDHQEFAVDDKSEIRAAMDYIASVFCKPLELKGASLFQLNDELDDAADFCRNYFDCKNEDYRRIWYFLHSAEDAHRWSNLLIVCELLFSLPFTNSKVERSFSHLKVIKSERRSSLSTSTLDDLMEINMEGPPFESFTADSAVHLWWKDTTRRPNQKERKEYAPRESSSSKTDINELSKPTEEYSLDDWDEWFLNTSS